MELIEKILKKLKSEYKNPKIELNYNSPFQLLIATILSAQCTDDRVNKVTKELFKKYNKPEDFLKLSQEELEKLIKPTGFYKNKAKNILNCCKQLVESFNSKTPKNIEDLTKLSGVGRKTANVILGECFNIPGIVVDTHVKRVVNRLGLSNYKDPEKIEKDLMKKIPKEYWIFFSKSLILHGRYICKARKPYCSECIFAEICPSNNSK